MQQRRRPGRRGGARWRPARSLPRRDGAGHHQPSRPSGRSTEAGATEPSGWRTRLGRVAALLATLAIGSYCLYLGGRAAVMDVLLAGDGPVAQAVAVRQGGQGKGQVLSVVESFTTADGRRVEADVDQFRRPVPLPGAVRQVRYHPDHPTWCVREVAHGAEVADLLVFFPLGLLFLAYPVSRLCRAVRLVSRRGRLPGEPAQT